MCILTNGNSLLSIIFFLAYIHLRALICKEGNVKTIIQLKGGNITNGRKILRRPQHFVKYKTCNKKSIKKIRNKLYESDKVDRPERKLECYELNIRNDKKFEKYAKKPASPMSNLFYFSPFKNIINSFEPVDIDVKKKLREEGFQYENEKSESNIFPSLDEIIRDGDPSTNMHFYRRKKLKSILYRDPNKFANSRKIIENYNKRVPPEKRIDYDSFKCDIFYVHSDGTIMNIEEERPPYDKKLEESERNKEPRFVIMTPIGDKFPVINEKQKKILFDNHFAKPKKIRDPLVLPDGRKIP